MPFWKHIESLVSPDTVKGPKSTFKTSDAYDIIGNDHVKHVQAKINQEGVQDDFEIVLPNPNQLQIDYDSPTLPEQFHKALDLLTQAYCKLHQSLFYTVRKSRHGNLHVTIDLPNELQPQLRIAWQVIFGSDPMREGLSLMSTIRGIKNPILLIERRNEQPVTTGVSTLTPNTGRKFRA